MANDDRTTTSARPGSWARQPPWSPATRKLLRVGFAAGVLALAVGATLAASAVLRGRRAALEAQVGAQMDAVLTTVGNLVQDRAQDVRGDLELAVEVLQQARHSRERQLEAVRSHLIGLDRANRHYLRLWYLEDGEALIEVSGFRATPAPLPAVDPRTLARLDTRAHAAPGRLVTARVPVPEGSPFRTLRLMALGVPGSAATLAVLVNMDVLFDALQARASLPGLDLWVLDGDGSLLVAPDAAKTPRCAQAAALLAADRDPGRAMLGPEPSLWPFSDRGFDSQMLAWRGVEGTPFRWTTGAAVPLTGVASQLHELAVTLLLVSALALLALTAVAGVVLWQARRQARLRLQLSYLAAIDGMRAQLMRVEKLATLGQVAGGLAHEVGTPLGVIAIRIEQLLGQLDDERQRATLRVMSEQIERINRIMRQVLDLARPRASRLREVSVREAATQVADLVELRPGDGPRLTVDVPATSHVEADADQFHQVLLNLIVNARDACGPGDEVTVRVLDDLDDRGRVGIEVADTGPGIEPRLLDHVFEPFFTTKPPGEGTGLGLTIVRELVQRHGGDVELHGGERGTRVRIWWPSPGSARAPLEIIEPAAASSVEELS